jgi:uncharacterized RDD family membrane protein YckC
MTCPQCQSTDIDESGTCRVCGFRPTELTASEAGPQNERKAFSGPFEMDFSEKNDKDQQDLPEWRKELSRRLHEIKQKREERPSEPAVALTRLAAAVAGGSTQPPALAQAPPAPAATATMAPEAALEPPGQDTQTPKSARRSPIAQRRAAAPRVSRPPSEGQDSGSSGMPLFQKPAETKLVPQRPEEVKDVIDRAVGLQMATSDGTAFDHRLSLTVPLSETAEAVGQPLIEQSRPDRLILLSRTLAGLVDLIMVAACTLGVLAATDFVSGIGNVDWHSMLVYSALLILIFLLYSVFFLGTANQTIGMMITDLRVLGEDKRRPGFQKVLGRSAAYLVSLMSAGIGLLWGCFDEECRCWHDRLSGTRVVRLS